MSSAIFEQTGMTTLKSSWIFFDIHGCVFQSIRPLYFISAISDHFQGEKLSKPAYLLPGSLTLLAILVLFCWTGMPAASPATTGLSFEKILIVKIADPFPESPALESAEGFMKVAEYNANLAPPQFDFQDMVALPEIEGSEGAVVFAVLAAASIFLGIARKKWGRAP